MITKPSYDQLFLVARDTLKKAYVPYSGRANGVALLTGDGRIFSGCTIEIANFSSGVCAAKAALIKAITEGARQFSVVAVVGDGADSHYLCGDCRQFLAEFSPDSIVISEANPDKPLALSKLLPNAFGRSEHTGR